MELPIESGAERLFLRAEGSAVSIYAPASGTGLVSGRASVRFREALSESGDEIVMEGTLATQERLELGSRDLVLIHLPLGDATVDLYGRLEAVSSMASGEWRLRTLPTVRPAEIRDALKACCGIPFENVRFELMPLVGSPFDLYSLGVLAVRTFLVDDDTTLPKALDETLSLARQVASQHMDDEPLRGRVEAVFQSDPRWMESLGPHRLSHRLSSPADGFDLVPADLWYDLLGLVIRMFPGAGPDSFRRDLADVSGEGLHLVYEPVLEAMESLVLRSRSLVVIDWRLSREIGGVLRHFRAGMRGGGSA